MYLMIIIMTQDSNTAEKEHKKFVNMLAIANGLGSTLRGFLRHYFGIGWEKNNLISFLEYSGLEDDYRLQFKGDWENVTTTAL